MKDLMLKLWKDEEGATMVEYVLLVALIALVAVGAIKYLATGVTSSFNKAGDQVK